MTLTFVGFALGVLGAGEWSLDEALDLRDDLLGVTGPRHHAHRRCRRRRRAPRRVLATAAAQARRLIRRRSRLRPPAQRGRGGRPCAPTCRAARRRPAVPRAACTRRGAARGGRARRRGVGAWRRSVTRDDDGDADLAHHIVGPRDDHACGDVRVRGQLRLDLHRVHVVATADVHLLRPSREPEQPALVELPEVAGAEPAAVEHRARRGGVAPVARHRAGRPQQDLADLAVAGRVDLQRRCRAAGGRP